MTSSVCTKTTGWTEETRNQFHPGDVIQAINRKWMVFSPHAAVGLAELVCHVLGEGRESCQRHISQQGSISEFYIHFLLRARLCEAYLCEQFPELAKYSDDITDEELQEIGKTAAGIEGLVRNVEACYGKTVTVLPMPKSRESIAESVAAEQRAFLTRMDTSLKMVSKL